MKKRILEKQMTKEMMIDFQRTVSHKSTCILRHTQIIPTHMYKGQEAVANADHLDGLKTMKQIERGDVTGAVDASK